jgi:putative NADH-flavin reductase
MRVAVFGATGGVGRWLMAIARENEDHLKILARDPAELPGDLGAIGVVRGDVLDREAVDATAGGCDVVFSALGARAAGPAKLYSQGIANIIGAMQRASITRLLALSCAGVEDDPNLSFFARRILAPFARREAYADLRLMEDTIRESGLVWTIVRPAPFTDGPRTGLYRASDRFLPERGRAISRADVADFMHRVMVDERTIRKTVALAY